MQNEFEILRNYSEIPSSSLKIERAIAVLKAIMSYPFAELISCGTNGNEEIIKIRFEVQIPQTSSHVQRYEEMGIIFSPEDNAYPEVLSLRSDFPEDVPHLNLRDYDLPKSLCLYEIPFDEVKLTLSGHKLIDDIRNWLRLTAIGSLHQPDQPLEPLLVSDDGVVFFTKDALTTANIEAIVLNEINGRPFILCQSPSAVHEFHPYKTDQYHAIYLQGTAVLQHGVISRTPKNIGELAAFLRKAGIELRLTLFNVLKMLGERDVPANNSLLDKKILFFVGLPKSRNASDNDVFFDYYCFFSRLTFREIGITSGLYEFAHGKLGTLLIQPENIKLDSPEIGMMRPQQMLSSELARLYNRVAEYPEKEPMFFCIGAGALGSHAFLNLARSGYGLWRIIDNDVLLPHNLARHAADLHEIGRFKADVVCAKANRLNSNAEFSIPIIENAIHPKQAEPFYNELKKSDIVIDFSASVAVERHIANDSRFSSKLITSFFLNPRGDALVMLKQDKELVHPLDYLEMQYYRFVINENNLAGHLDIEMINGLRISNSCRDISGRIPQDAISVFAGIASANIKRILTNPEAEASIWIMNETSDITKYSIPISKTHNARVAGWEVLWDDHLREKLFSKRKNELPNETGGILLGAFDIHNRKIYIVESILSPDDSEEYPYAYIRGIKGVREKLDSIDRETAGMIQYIGEWHSHPEGATLGPSDDDELLQKWLTEQMAKSGLPGLMIIVGNAEFNILLTNAD